MNIIIALGAAVAIASSLIVRSIISTRRALGLRFSDVAAEAPDGVKLPSPLVELPVVVPPVVKGIVGYLSHARVSGWAFIPAEPDEHVVVEVIASGQVIGTGRADLFQENLLDAKIGAGDHWFDIQIDPSTTQVGPEEFIFLGICPKSGQGILHVAAHAIQAMRARRNRASVYPSARSDETGLSGPPLSSPAPFESSTGNGGSSQSVTNLVHHT